MSRSHLALGFILACGALAVLAYAAWSESAALRAQVAETRCQIEGLARRVSDLRTLAHRLQTDPAAMEETARDQGFARPGETILRFPRTREAPATATAACRP